MKINAPGLLGMAVLVLGTVAAEPIAPRDFEKLHGLIRPQVGEAKWATIPWLTNLKQAREQAVASDKPLFVWRAGGGGVLGRA